MFSWTRSNWLCHPIPDQKNFHRQHRERLNGPMINETANNADGINNIGIAYDISQGRCMRRMYGNYNPGVAALASKLTKSRKHISNHNRHHNIGLKTLEHLQNSSLSRMWRSNPTVKNVIALNI